MGIPCATESRAGTCPERGQCRRVLVPAQAGVVSSLLGIAQLPLHEVGLKAAFLLHGAGEEQTQRSTGTEQGIVCKDFLT